MKCEILRQRHPNAGKKTFFASLWPGFFAAVLIFSFSLLLPLHLHAQPANRSKQSLKKLQVKYGLSERQLAQLRPLIELQAGNLVNIFLRYSEKCDTGFFPFWSDTSIWRDLRFSRQQIEEAGTRITNKQRKALQAIYLALEKKALTLLLDDQITLLDDLDLTELQSQDIYDILALEIKRNRSLIGNRALGDDIFEQKLIDISNETEKKIEEILFPGQRKIYQQNKQGGTGLWAASRSGVERPRMEKIKFTPSSPDLSATPTPTPVPSPEPAEKRDKKTGIGMWSVVPAAGDLPQAVELNRAQSASSPAPTPEAESKKQKRGEFVIAPIPVINPTLGNGLAVAAGYLFKLDKKDKVSPPSGIGFGAFRTSNGSWGMGGGAMLHLRGDRFRVAFFAAHASANLKFYGVGQNSGNAGISIPIAQKGSGFMIDGLMRVHGKWYAGLRYWLMKTKVNVTAEQNEGDGNGNNNGTPVIPVIDINLRTAALGPHILYDSRDDQTYPGQGSQFDVRMLFSGKAVGGRRSYQNYSLFYAKYFTLAPKQILAARGAGCFVRGNAPFYDLCLLGQSQNLRGYDASRYRDRNMLAAQAEYRLELPKRFGLVAFAGLGEVANEFGKFSLNKILPGAGAGLRFRLTKQNKVNLRLDYAVGKSSHALYVSVGEAF